MWVGILKGKQKRKNADFITCLILRTRLRRFVVPRFKKVPVLPVFSKILEKHVSSSLFKFVHVRDNNLLYELQSAFRSGHSTETALIRLTDHILTNMDDDKLTGLVFIDFRKAFDVIDHQRLLTKAYLRGLSLFRRLV